MVRSEIGQSEVEEELQVEKLDLTSKSWICPSWRVNSKASKRLE